MSDRSCSRGKLACLPAVSSSRAAKAAPRGCFARAHSQRAGPSHGKQTRGVSAISRTTPRANLNDFRRFDRAKLLHHAELADRLVEDLIEHLHQRAICLVEHAVLCPVRKRETTTRCWVSVSSSNEANGLRRLIHVLGSVHFLRERPRLDYRRSHEKPNLASNHQEDEHYRSKESNPIQQGRGQCAHRCATADKRK
jgi:hypothetical protein